MDILNKSLGKSSLDRAVQLGMLGARRWLEASGKIWLEKQTSIPHTVIYQLRPGQLYEIAMNNKLEKQSVVVSS